ncbi:MAG: hypothetical protein AB7K24_21630 [Gemmataceae bacterium]
MTENHYDGAMEPWKVEVITERAKRLGFRRHDLEDAQQQVVLKLLTCQFDLGNLVKASERTAFTKIVDNLLITLRRSEQRGRARLERYAAETGVTEEVSAGFEQLDMASDVSSALTELSPFDRQICESLTNGDDVTTIAERLNVKWHTIRDHIKRIRLLFERLGLDLVCERGAPALLTASQAAAMCSKSTRTWRTWDAEGLVPSPVKIGRSILWRAEEIQAWIKAGCPSREVWNAK